MSTTPTALTPDRPTTDRPTPTPTEATPAAGTPAAGASPTAQQARERFWDLSLTQVVGGSLAAATAAALGSRLGLVGTIAGAAAISVISAVSASLYTQSMRRTRDRLVSQRRALTPGLPTVVSPAPPDAQVGSRSPRRAVLRAVATAVAVFAVAATAITGWELVTGSSLSGEERTTFSEVTRSRGAVSVEPAGTVDGLTTSEEGSSTTGRSDPGGEASADRDGAPGTSGSEEDGSGAEASPGEAEPTPAEPTPSAPPSDPAGPADPGGPAQPSDPVDPVPGGPSGQG